MRTTGLALSFSAAEYAAPVWRISLQIKQPIDKVYPIIGVASPATRRQVTAEIEKGKQQIDPWYLMYGHRPQPTRLKSHQSFAKTTAELKI